MKLIYKDALALETMGQVNCLIIDLSIWIKDTFEGVSEDVFKERLQDKNVLEMIRSIAYLL